MAGMYLRECLIENVGPITICDVSLQLNSSGHPKPVILVGKNGTGKTIFLAYVLDALAELAKQGFRDIVVGQQVGSMPYLKTTSSADVRSLSGDSLALLEFSDSDKHLGYLEKIGTIDYQEKMGRLQGRFQSVGSWTTDEINPKKVTGDKRRIEAFFQTSAVCFFPASRHERPHWLNVGAVVDQPVFGDERRWTGQLGKPLIIERAAESNRQWLMDVLMDSLVDAEIMSSPSFPGQPPAFWCQPRSNLQDKLLLGVGRKNIEQLIRSVLEDEKAELIINYRSATTGRVSIRLGSGVIVPSLFHLSAGQALLFNSTVRVYSLVLKLHSLSRGFVRGGGNFLVRSYQ